MADASCPGIISNPDLVGVGTRTNLYVTIFLAAIIPKHKYTTKLLNELYMNAAFYGFAIVITVLVQTIQGQLDLYHAVFVVHLLACLSSFQLYGISAPRLDLNMKITLAIQFCQFMIIFPLWSLYVWIKNSRFGPQPECNHLVKYVIFFVNVRATVNWLRVLTITMLSFGIFTVLLGSSTLLLFIKWFIKTNFKQDEDERPDEDKRPDENKRPDEEMDVEVGSLSISTSVFSFCYASYFIVHAELIVHRNRAHVQAGENAWGFSQIVSVLLLLPIFIEIVATLWKWHSRVKRRNSNDKGEEVGREAEAEGQEVELDSLPVIRNEGTGDGVA